MGLLICIVVSTLAWAVVLFKLIEEGPMKEYRVKAFVFVKTDSVEQAEDLAIAEVAMARRGVPYEGVVQVIVKADSAKLIPEKKKVAMVLVLSLMMLACGCSSNRPSIEDLRVFRDYRSYDPVPESMPVRREGGVYK